MSGNIVYLTDDSFEDEVVKAGSPAYRLRQTLLAVVDCPYVRELQDDIARYAAAGELHLAWKENKS